MTKILSATAFLMFMLVGCASMTPSPPLLVERQPLNVPNPPSVEQQPYSWMVITKDNEAEILSKNPVIFGLAPEDYKNQVLDEANMRMFVLEEMAIIQAFRDYEAAPDSKQPTAAPKKPWWRIW